MHVEDGGGDGYILASSDRGGGEVHRVLLWRVEWSGVEGRVGRRSSKGERYLGQLGGARCAFGRGKGDICNCTSVFSVACSFFISFWYELGKDMEIGNLFEIF